MFQPKKSLALLGHKLIYKNIYFLAWIITNLKGYILQLDNSQKFIFVSQNWLNDPRIGYSLLTNQVELIEKNLDQKKKKKKKKKTII